MTSHEYESADLVQVHVFVRCGVLSLTVEYSVLVFLSIYIFANCNFLGSQTAVTLFLIHKN